MLSVKRVPAACALSLWVLFAYRSAASHLRTCPSAKVVCVERFDEPAVVPPTLSSHLVGWRTGAGRLWEQSPDYRKVHPLSPRLRCRILSVVSVPVAAISLAMPQQSYGHGPPERGSVARVRAPALRPADSFSHSVDAFVKKLYRLYLLAQASGSERKEHFEEIDTLRREIVFLIDDLHAQFRRNMTTTDAKSAIENGQLLVNKEIEDGRWSLALYQGALAEARNVLADADVALGRIPQGAAIHFDTRVYYGWAQSQVPKIYHLRFARELDSLRARLQSFDEESSQGVGAATERISAVFDALDRLKEMPSKLIRQWAEERAPKAWSRFKPYLRRQPLYSRLGAAA